LCNPDVLRALRGQVAPNAGTKPSHGSALKDALRRTWDGARTTVAGAFAVTGRSLGRACAWVAAKVGAAADAVATRAGKAVACFGTARQKLVASLPQLWQFRKPLAVAAAIGIAIGVACYWSGPL